MKVNDLAKTSGYTRGCLEHFEFWICDYENYTYYKITAPSIDEYIFLCDRDIIEWTFEEDMRISIMVKAEPKDREIFKNKSVSM